MAKAYVKRSKRGNDLINLTLGPKEVASVVSVLANGPSNQYTKNVVDVLGAAKFTTSNEKFAAVKTTPETKELVLS